MSENESDMLVLYARATFDDAERRAVNDVLDDPETLVGGRYTDEFQSGVAARFGKEHGVMVNSGSSANFLAIELLDLPARSEVITPLTTFSTTVAPIVQHDLVPVFVDVGLGDYQVDVDQVESAITDRTEALMIPSLVGNVPDLRELHRIASEHDLHLIEDSADTIGATVRGEPTGTYTDITTTSFYGSHVITTLGCGGMVCVDDDSLMRRAKKLRGWGRRSAVDETESIETRMDNRLGDVSYDSKFVFDEIGYNFLPSEANAAFGVKQLDKLDEFLQTRRRNFDSLYRFFERYEDHFILPQQRDDVETSWLAFPLTIRRDSEFDRGEIVKYLERSGIQTRSLWSGNILKHPGFVNIDHRLPFECENSDTIMESSFVIGCHQSMGENELDHVRTTFRTFIEDNTS